MMRVVNYGLYRYMAPKSPTTFRMFPADAPSAEALALPRSRDRASSDPVPLAKTLAHSRRQLPPTPIDGSPPPPSESIYLTSSAGTYTR